MATPPLWQQLQATIDVLAQVEQGQSAATSLNSVNAQLRPAAQALTFAVWRQMGYARHVAVRLAAKPPKIWVQAALWCGLALLAPANASLYDEFTLVDQLVEAVKRCRKESRQAAFVNACLRRFLRERQALEASVRDVPEARWNFPAWWIRRVQSDHPEQWEQVLQASNQAAPMTLRVNRRQTNPELYVERLVGQGFAAKWQGGQAVVLEQPVPVGRLPDFVSGHVSVQDAGAQQAAELLLKGYASTAATRILDACAAPGGKTGHLLELSDAQVHAVEVDPVRAERIGENLQRLGLQAQVHCASLTDLAAWWDGQPFDLVLLDAPCTASGIVRRHPDVRWQRRESDIEALAQTQRLMLECMWPLVRPGGRLLFCTCSIFASEGRAQQAAFLAHNKDAQLLPSPGHLLPTNALQTAAVAHNVGNDHDGFFYALFEKVAA
ncbi:16S rRNA (cytosine(967)-C(5))-methyltransferase RsmB [Curvibacter sp. APW13]|uniref:16S rRNA (cytosine(967)-C(5))-methyltransferase RsmB n=1 Tax=Curvibacter sp. APW13 TaxID=3077236 RepID=UPI0028DDD494|nr:16S rRNA (cytosine(967)-C(5))-methyltransferase RsmB [Curvibacter sp. APW13]MDT8993111.1 16S rRNA (cytosine(967)-C(5))-methyltransferase RsmB [Curvibacter sp. APW13]